MKMNGTALLIIGGIVLYVVAVVAVAWQKLKGGALWKR